MQVNETGTILHVSPQGRAQATGSRQDPFATPHQARDFIRSHRNALEEPITVCVAGGGYRFCEPLVFQAEDSGDRLQPIRYVAAGDEPVVFSAGSRVEASWQPWRDGIYRCRIAEGEPARSGFSLLFANGKRQVRARFPNLNPSVPEAGTWIHPSDRQTEWPHRELAYDPATFTEKTWAHPERAIVHIFGKNDWGNLQWQVAGVDRKRETIRLGHGGFQINDIMQGADATGIDKRSRYFIENILEELDCPGEWYFDPDLGDLYYMPEPGVHPDDLVIEVSGLKRLVSFAGRQEDPVRGIVLSGFLFTHTDVTYLDEYEAPSLGDWTIHRGGAVYMEGTEECEISDCTFHQVGGNAVFLSNACRRNILSRNTISEAGDSAFCLVGSKHLSLGSRHPYPEENVICDNEIHHIGIFGKQTAGVFLSVGRRNRIEHNHIHHVPRAAICINDGTWGGHVIAWNDIHDTVLETGDHGPFNSWGRDRFWCLQQSHGPCSHAAGNVLLDAREVTIVRNNRFRDNRGWGIDLDDGSSNYQIVGNLCIGVSIKLREGDFRTVENNIFVNCANPPGFHIGYEENHDIFRRNIIYMSIHHDRPEHDIDFHRDEAAGAIYDIIGPPAQGPWFQEWDHNVFFSDRGEFVATALLRPLGVGESKQFTLAQWQELGFDRHSTYADPCFVDLDQEDFTLRPESPAFQVGFVPFDLNAFGIRKNR